MSLWSRFRSRNDPAPPSEDAEEWAKTSEEILRAKRARQQALVGKEALVAEVSAILFVSDPIGINYESNTDEYDSEAETILLRIDEATGPTDVQRIAHEEFVRWFDAQMAGPLARYAEIGQQIWAAANRKALP